MSEQLNFVDGCAFCEIAQGRSRTTEVIAETDSWLAFFPLEPATVGHTIVIPKTHVSDLWDVGVSLGSELMAAAVRVGRAIDDALTPPGMNLITSAGRAAEQTVFHLHLHLVPRWEGDNFDAIWPETSVDDGATLRRAAESIRRGLKT